MIGIVIIIGLILYALGYFGYSKWYDRHVIESDPKRTTPAHTYMDGVEFFPTSRWVLFGFHAKSIAGLGPLVGPVVAVVWGWLPGLLWIILGTIFSGWLHDYMSLVTSCRSEGASFGPISYKLLGPRGRSLVLGFVIFYLYLLLAGFVPILAGTLATFSMAVIPTLFVVIAGLLFALLTYKLRVYVVHSTIISLIVVVIGLALGLYYPVSMAALWWIPVVLIFCILGAVLPIWVFLQPINYLAFYVVYIPFILALIGGIVGNPAFGQPAFTALVHPALGPIWPILFVTIACGATSGWHSLVSSSASSKQVDNEADYALVGGGSMYMEGIIALGAMMFAAALKVLPPAPAARFVSGGAELLKYLAVPEVVGRTVIATSFFICGITLAHLALRVVRLFQTEVAGLRFKGIFKNVYSSAIIASIIVGILAATGTWIYIWILFGSSNQLMAALALIIATLWLLSERKPTIFTGVPMVFMYVTTMSALGITTYKTYEVAVGKFTVGEVAAGVGNSIAAVIGTILLILGLILAYDGARAFVRIKKAPK